MNKYFFLFQVSIYAEDHLLDALFLQHLLSQLTGDNLSLYFNDYTDQLLDGESLYTTLKKDLTIVGTISGHFATKRLATGRFATETSQLAKAFLFPASTLPLLASVAYFRPSLLATQKVIFGVEGI